MTWTIVIGVIAASLVAIVAALGRSKRARYHFEDREDHLVLTLEGEMESDDQALIIMSTLREAVRLKLGSDYRRLIVDARRAHLTGEASFWLLVGGLGPLFLSDTMKTAILCRPKKPLGRRFKESALAPCFGSEAEALAYLRSATTAPKVALDRDWVESLLVARGRVSRPRLRKAA